jgi:TPR repeat protein
MLSIFLSAAAKAGHRRAQFEVGMRLRNGDGVKINQTKAFEWLQKGLQLQILL